MQQQHLIGPAVITVVVALLLYRRLRSHFGRQLIRPTRLWVRVGIMTVVAVLLLAGSFAQTHLFEASLAGLLGGGLFAVLGLRLTRYEQQGLDQFYIPNPWIGALLTALLVARLLWRFLVAVPAAVHQVQPAHGPVLGNSPLTSALVGLTLGYYALYYFGVLRHAGRISSSPGLS